MRRRDPSEGRAVLGFLETGVVVKRERGRLPPLYWTGTTWTDDPAKALLYAHGQLAYHATLKLRPELPWWWLGVYLGGE